MGDVFDAVSARIKAPYFGYAVLAFLAWNWRGLFLLVMTEGAPDQRLAVFDMHTSVWSLYVAPLLTGIVVAASAEWIRFVFEWVARNPQEWMEMHYIHVEHQKAIAKAEFEKLRVQRFARKEEELIARAQRDEKINEISDEEVKHQLQVAIDALREEKEKNTGKEELVSEIKLPSIPARELLLNAGRNSGKISKGSNQFGGNMYISSGKFRIEKEENPREYSRYDAALTELEKARMITPPGLNQELTEEGWKIYDILVVSELA